MQQLFRLAVSVPGGATAVLPTWPLALKVLLRAGAKQLTLSAALAAGSSTHCEQLLLPATGGVLAARVWRYTDPMLSCGGCCGGRRNRPAGCVNA